MTDAKVAALTLRTEHLRPNTIFKESILSVQYRHMFDLIDAPTTVLTEHCLLLRSMANSFREDELFQLVQKTMKAPGACNIMPIFETICQTLVGRSVFLKVLPNISYHPSKLLSRIILTCMSYSTNPQDANQVEKLYSLDDLDMNQFITKKLSSTIERNLNIKAAINQYL
ncbi:hypothetical protein ACOME3_007723 [Neoechinorhynchus agilis]